MQEEGGVVVLCVSQCQTVSLCRSESVFFVRVSRKESLAGVNWGRAELSRVKRSAMRRDVRLVRQMKRRRADM